ncbi:MAG: TRAP transporter large permease subunit [Gammaproteobacteria bacterium]|nr:TRAP transporter large permease subunit [Gammaproteobacteria bacterium]
MDQSMLSLLMFAALFLALGLGLHIAFSLYAIAIGFAYFLWGTGGMTTTVMAIWGMMNNFALLAIPLFIFMAMMLEKSNLVADIYDCFYKWSGALRGGLAIATILVGAIIGAVSGVVAAGVIGLGVIALPQMEKYGYNRGVNLGSIMSGGTLGQIIPPCLVMIVYSAVTGVSVGKLFAAGVSAGLLLVALFSLYILTRSYFQKDFCPSLPEELRVGWKEKIVALRVLILPGLLIVATVGSILSGMATPTEGAGVGAFGAIMFSVVTGRFKLRILTESMLETLKVSSMIAWMIGGAAAFGSVFAGIGGNRVILEVAMNMPGGEWGVLVLSMAFIFFLGMFLETMAVIMLAAPIVSPILVSMGFDPLWWAIIFMTLLQVAYISPPFGVALFYLKGVTPPHIRLSDIYWASLPFIGLQVIAVILIVLFPILGLWLPRML